MQSIWAALNFIRGQILYNSLYKLEGYRLVVRGSSIPDPRPSTLNPRPPTLDPRPSIPDPPELITQVFAHEHHNVAALGATVAQQVDVAADALGAVAVVAHAVEAAGCGDVETLGVDGRGGAACPGDGGLYG